MYCDVASGFNFKIGHFLHLNRVEREKVTLRFKIRFRIQWKGLARLRSTISVEPIIQENVADLRHRSALKKKSNLSFIESKRTPIALILRRLNTKKSRYFS